MVRSPAGISGDGGFQRWGCVGLEHSRGAEGTGEQACAFRVACRFHRALRRSRRGEDHLRARAAACARRRGDGHEPDLSACALLCRPPAYDLSLRFLQGRAGRGRRNRLGGAVLRGGGSCGVARRDPGQPAAGPARGADRRRRRFAKRFTRGLRRVGKETRALLRDRRVPR